MGAIVEGLERRERADAMGGQGAAGILEGQR